MRLDLLIDKLTPCLLELATSELKQTTFSIASSDELEGLQKHGWNFDWSIYNTNPSMNIYKLTIKDDKTIQGLIATEFNKNAVYVELAESAPHNLNPNKVYEGVGGHLFAIGIKLSNALGFGGYIYFDAKNLKLVKHYKDTLQADHLPVRIHPYRMEVNEEKAQLVLATYTLEGDLNVG